MKSAHLPTLFGLCLVVACGCQKAGTSAKSEPPAKVAQPGDEPSLNTITLTVRAEERLGLRVAEVKREDVRRMCAFGGEVVVVPGQTAVVTAPMVGVLSAPDPAAVPAPGIHLAKGQAVFSFTPVLTPERDVLTPAERVGVAQSRANIATAQIEAERQVTSARVNVDAAQLARDRAGELLKNKAGSQRSVDEAETALKLAQEALAAARARYEFLSTIELDEAAGEIKSRAIQSPVAGVLQSVDVAAGETVAAGEVLFRVVKLDTVWIRVPVYVGRWREIDSGAEATVAEYGQSPDAPTRSASYVAAPPSADPNATTVDLFYQLDNEDASLYPGQRVSVTLPLKSHEDSLVVPWSAILHDIHGGEWVYEQIEPLTYARRRCLVAYVDGPSAVLSAGPEPGASVVTDGAVELFGTEFGVGK